MGREVRRLLEFDRAWLGGEGIPDALRSALADLGIETLTLPERRPWEAPGDGELVVLSVDDGTRNPFTTCARLRHPGGRKISFVLVCRESDCEFVEPLGRFVMADAVLVHERLEADPLEQLESFLTRPAPRESVDVLLARLEEKLGDPAAGDNARQLAERVVTGLSADREQTFIASVTDPETGLFDGPFMAFKLEEEFKRATRFRTPLAVLLVDLPNSRELGAEQARVLGEVAGVFLNECRDIDVLGRYDDTSFLLLLPSTGRHGATVLADRVLKLLRAVASPVPLEPAVAIVTVPRTGIERKDELLDLARLTLISAWGEDGDRRVRIAD